MTEDFYIRKSAQIVRLEPPQGWALRSWNGKQWCLTNASSRTIAKQWQDQHREKVRRGEITPPTKDDCSPSRPEWYELNPTLEQQHRRFDVHAHAESKRKK